MENVAETKVDERKRLEWAGFTYQQSDMYGAEYTHPEQPKDIRSYIAGCAYSLDFQAKYLLPKLFTWSIGRNWRIEENNDLKVGEIVPDGIKAIVQLTGPFSPEGRGIAATAGEALLLAFQDMFQRIF